MFIKMPMCIKIRPEFQCLEQYNENSKVYKNRARFPMLERIGPQVQCLQWKDKITIPLFG